ncbi:hypothetical protein, partial [Phocaeicola oris]|uniref:hypothetical protein n=1 Tax=Phocaeicola oris TaxID=2896850 RepID=UPI00234E822F
NAVLGCPEPAFPESAKKIERVLFFVPEQGARPENRKKQALSLSGVTVIYIYKVKSIGRCRAVTKGGYFKS